MDNHHLVAVLISVVTAEKKTIEEVGISRNILSVNCSFNSFLTIYHFVCLLSNVGYCVHVYSCWQFIH